MIKMLPRELRTIHLFPHQKYCGPSKVNYNGHVYDSVVEARWGIFFTLLKPHDVVFYPHHSPMTLPKRVVTTNSVGFYQPDGLVANFGGDNFLTETKSEKGDPTPEELEKCRLTAILEEAPMVLLQGPPGGWNRGRGGAIYYFHPAEVDYDKGYVIDMCPACKRPWLRKIGSTKHACGLRMPLTFDPFDVTPNPYIEDLAYQANTKEFTERDLRGMEEEGIYPDPRSRSSYSRR